MTYIIDSSVALKWFYEEEDREKALLIYDDLARNAVSVVVPHLIIYEIGNIIRYKKPFSIQKIEQAEKILAELNLAFDNPNYQEWKEIIELCHKLDISFYDCSYVFLAKKYNIKLITADKKLYRKAKKSGLVKLL